jgi:hypothetical protein
MKVYRPFILVLLATTLLFLTACAPKAPGSDETMRATTTAATAKSKEQKHDISEDSISQRLVETYLTANTMPSQKEIDIYDNLFSDKDAWQSTANPGGPADSIIEYPDFDFDTNKFVDIDGDGNFECWFVVATEYGDKVSFLYGIENGKPKSLVTPAYLSSGTMGGSTIQLLYDTKTKAHVICVDGYTGGFGGYAQYATFYAYKNNQITKLSEIETITQPKDFYEAAEVAPDALFYAADESDPTAVTIYKVNGKQAAKQEYQAIRDRFTEAQSEEFVLEYDSDAVG